MACLKHINNKRRKRNRKSSRGSLTTKMIIKEKKVMYMQHNREREQGCGGRGYGRSADCRRGNNNEERGQMN